MLSKQDSHIHGISFFSYIIGDKSILIDAGVKGVNDIENLPAPPELKATQKYRGDVSYFICTRPGSGPTVLTDESFALLDPATGLPK